jgi:hypothetical protein
VWLVVAGVGLLQSGCQTGPEVEPDVSLADKSNAEILFEAILASLDKRGLEVDSASRRFMVITSGYESVATRLRRRFTIRIVQLPGGSNALRVRAEHERRHGSGERSEWRKAEGDAIEDRAEKAELELGRAIERRFREYKEYKEANEKNGTDK